MAVSATGSGFNATILDYKDWLESQTPEDIDELGRELAKQTTTNKKGVRFFYDTVDRVIVFAPHPGRTAVQGYFKRSEYEEADDKRAYVERCISLAIIAYMELVSLQHRTSGFWRHNYNQGLVIHADAPHLAVEDIIDIASRATDDKTLDEFAAQTEHDLQWFLSIENGPSEPKANSKRLYEQWSSVFMHTSNDNGEHLERLTSRFKLDADKLYEAVKGWRLFSGADGTYYYQHNPLLKVVKIIDLLGIDEGMPNGTCGVLCFGPKGGRDGAMRFTNGLKMVAIVTHVADARSCVLHPASHTHRQLNDQQLIEAGVLPDLIRLSVGIEDVNDIIADLDQALANV